MEDVWGLWARMCMQFCCIVLRIKKELGIFRELITTTTTRVAFWDRLPGQKYMKPSYNNHVLWFTSFLTVSEAKDLEMAVL